MEKTKSVRGADQFGIPRKRKIEDSAEGWKIREDGEKSEGTGSSSSEENEERLKRQRKEEEEEEFLGRVKSDALPREKRSSSVSGEEKCEGREGEEKKKRRRSGAREKERKKVCPRKGGEKEGPLEEEKGGEK
ncbi:hypothetical protein KM043_004698 [Ampulex compressa]|nr:hypothetical protein KM043_004698 [Ampulex compressa]